MSSQSLFVIRATLASIEFGLPLLGQSTIPSTYDIVTGKRNMNRYLVMTSRKSTFQEASVVPHYDFLARLREQGRLELAGPFSDKSGGAYVLRAESLGEAQAVAHSDPVHTSGSSLVTVYEWNAS